MTLNKRAKPTYLQLFLSFSKIGAFTFGGGYAMISIIENELVVKREWINRDDFYEYLTIAQMSPGILAVNISILMGNVFFGKKGAALCVIATCLPAFIIILSIAIFFSRFQDNIYVAKAFRAVRPIVIALILMPVLSMSKKARISYKTAFIPIAVVVLILFFRLSPVYIIMVAILIAIILAGIQK